MPPNLNLMPDQEPLEDWEQIGPGRKSNGSLGYFGLYCDEGRALSVIATAVVLTLAALAFVAACIWEAWR